MKTEELRTLCKVTDFEWQKSDLHLNNLTSEPALNFVIVLKREQIGTREIKFGAVFVSLLIPKSDEDP
ncbi:hypothetical protein STEG23_028939 [Scotinomys teguina]